MTRMRIIQVDLREAARCVDAAGMGPRTAEPRARRGRERPQARRRRLAGRAALRLALAAELGSDPASLELATDRDGKPFLAGRAAERDPLWFNLARSGELCVIAISRAGPVGVDVEEARGFPEMGRIAAARFAAVEAAGIAALGGEARRLAFYRCWTRKEAYLKGVGIGLAAGPESVAVSTGRRPALLSAAVGEPAEWSLADLDVGSGFAGAVAARHDLEEVAPGPIGPQPQRLGRYVGSPVPAS